MALGAAPVYGALFCSLWSLATGSGFAKVVRRMVINRLLRTSQPKRLPDNSESLSMPEVGVEPT